MATQIKLKNGSGAPLASDLVQGEPAFDLTNKRLYTEDSGGTVIEVGTNPTSITTGTIDATTVTADGLTVNGDILLGTDTDTARGSGFTRVLTKMGSGQSYLEIQSNNTTDENAVLFSDGSTGNYGALGYNHTNDALVGYTASTKRFEVGSGGDVSLYEDTGTTTKFFWDASAESLGIGTTSPNIAGFNSCLTIDGADAGLELSSGGTVYATLAANAQGANLQGVGTSGIRMFTAASGSATERMRIDSSGNVGIGGVPDSWSTVTNVLQMKDQYAISEHAGTGYLSQNWYYNAGEKYIGNGYAVRQFMSSVDGSWGVLRASNNSSGAGAALTWSESMRIDSSGKVGIGTSSPAVRTHLYTTEATNEVLRIENGTSARGAQVNFKNPHNSSVYIGVSGDSNGDLISYNGAATNQIFYTNATERMRIDSSGNLLVGSTSGSARINANTSTGSQDLYYASNNDGTTGGGACYVGNVSSTAQYLGYWKYGGTLVGSITTTGSATAYNTTSDYRLKENVVPMDDASSRVLALKPCRFNFIADPEKTVDGFLAHEAQEVVPEAVHGVKDGMRTEEYEVSPAVLDDEGNVVTEAVMGTREVPEYQGIDQSKLVPLLTKALQEALERIAALEAKVG